MTTKLKMAESFADTNAGGRSNEQSAWLQNYRRLCIRWEKSTVMFKAFLHLTCSLLLMKEVLG